MQTPTPGLNRNPCNLLADVARLVAQDRFSPRAWDRLDSHDVTMRGAHDRKDL
jgi:hypothetical protein